MRERLHKIIAEAGLASRRRAEKMILEGRVVLNGSVVSQLGVQADPEVDHIRVDGKRIKAQPLEYYAVHKPPGVLSAASDDGDRRVVVDLVPSKGRLYPAGRLDFRSEGLMILTNDGDLTRLILKAGGLEKVYRVKVQGVPQLEQLNKLRRGLVQKGERFARCRIKLLKKDRNSWFEVGLKQGRNRQVRRMFQAIGHRVMRLKRTAIGPIRLGDLKPGAYRRLTPREIVLLRKSEG